MAVVLPWRLSERKAKKQKPIQATAVASSGTVPNRAGFVQGVPPQGISPDRQGIGASTGTDRGSVLNELWDAYLKCPWSWAAVNAIARTVTAGGVLMKWDSDTGEGDQVQPPKPAQVLAFERLIAFCNPDQDIRQLMRNVVADLQVFGDALIEVAWLGQIPVALYNLDVPTTTPITDPHGKVTGWVQITQYGQRADFAPHEVIHISLDSARPGVFGVSPTAAAVLPITTWLYAAACEKQMFRKGLPPNIHIDFPAGKPEKEIRGWDEEYRAENLGTDNIGAPIKSKGGGKVNELQTGKIEDILRAKDQARNAILSAYGVPPAKAGVIESGNLGGGTGADQNRTYMLDVIEPIAMLIAEKLQFSLAVKAFGVAGWHVEFPTTDYRDEKVIEDIRDQRLRSGAWTLNRYRAEIGEPPVGGGDDAVLVARQDIVLWEDMAARSKMAVAAARTGTGFDSLGVPGPPPAAGTGPSKGPGGRPDSVGGPPPGETARLIAGRALGVVAEAAPRPAVRQQVYDQLVPDYAPSALQWVLDPGTEWDGPHWVAPGRVDASHADSWAAADDAGGVTKWRRRLRRGKPLKPVILVRTPGNTKYVVADGHHRVLASIAEGRMVRAFIGHVTTDKGGWDAMHARQYPVGPDGKRAPPVKARETATHPLTKGQVAYQPATEPDVRCGTCVMYSHNRCGIVQGDIDPHHTCVQWEARPARAGAA